ncbi:MAG: glycoside hydrolase family 38 C-terminal domain-containing protein [Promethearchaeia archaeon]
MSKEKKAKVFITPHFHYDYLWTDTADGMGSRTAKIIQKALLIMRKHPNFKYVIDSVMPLKYFRLHFPEMWDELKQRVEEKRIELVGGMVVAPDTLMARGETLIRQFLYGKKYLKKEFDTDAKIGYLLDSFGQTPQLPQILKKAGFEFFIFVRGARNLNLPQEFLWKAFDGSKILTHWMYATYTWVTPPFAQTILPPLFPFFPVPFTLNFLPQAFGLYEFLKKIFPPFKYLFQKIGSINAGVSILGADMGGLKFTIKNRLKRATTNNIFILNGTDNIPPSTNILDVTNYTEKHTKKYDLKISTPTEFKDALVKSNHKFGVFGPHEFNGFPDKFPGTFSTRVKLKQTLRGVENLQYKTECIAAFASFFSNFHYPQKAIEKALWKVLQSCFHDALPGCHIDAAYENIMERLNQASSMLGKIHENALNSLINIIKINKIKKNLLPLIIFNPSSAHSDEIVRFSLPKSLKNFQLLNTDGEIMKFQLDTMKDQDIYLFDPSPVPPLSFKVFYIKDLEPGEKSERIMEQSLEKDSSLGFEYSSSNHLREIHNSRFTLTFENDKLRTIRDKKTDNLIKSDKYFINELRIFNDRGDSYLHGKMPSKTYETYDNKAELIENGPVRMVVKVASKLKCKNKWLVKPTNEIIQYIILHNTDIPRIDFITRFRNKIKNVRIQACFPLNMKNPIFHSEVPDGFIERDTMPRKGSSWAEQSKHFSHYDRIFPVLNWMDATDKHINKGFSIINQGLPEYEIGPNKNHIFLTLMRSTGYLANIFPFAVPMVLAPFYSIPKAYELTHHEFRYSIFFHEGQEATNLIAQRAMNFNIGLICKLQEERKNGKPSINGEIPLVEVTPDNFLIKSVKMAENSEGIVIRILETADKKSKGMLKLYKTPEAVYLINLLEDPIKLISPNNKNMYPFHANPQEIITLLLKYK